MLSFIARSVSSCAVLGLIGSALAETPRRGLPDRHTAQPRLTLPGERLHSTLYHDGSPVQFDTEWRWRPICGSGAMTEKQLAEVAAAAHARMEAEKAGGDRQVQGVISGNSGCGIVVVFNIDGSVPTAAEAALQDVADYFSETFSDNVTFSVNVSFANLGGGILGATGSNYVNNVSYAAVRVNLQNDMDTNDAIQDFLPTGSTVPVRYTGTSDFISNQSTIDITRANYQAAIGPAGSPAANMTFNSTNSWDYDPSNGVSGFQTCFQSVIAHEVGHAMGFTSNADAGSSDMEMLDLFRFQSSDSCAAGGSCDYNPDNQTEFQTTPRLVDFNSPDDDAISDIGIGEWRMEDGSPWQASHFRQSVNAIMDPNLSDGQTFWPNFLLSPDLNMFDAIGWDYPPSSPCNDGDACTTDDICNGIACSGSAVDCSAMSTDCTEVTCDSGGPAGNCNNVAAVNENLPCNAGTGICQSGVCIAPGDTRSFMTAPGAESMAPTSGPTTITMLQGGTTTVEVWIGDTDPDLVGGYQLGFPGAATPSGGATGSVTYVDNGASDGDSVTIDTADPDWLFAGQASAEIFLSETGLPQGFAMLAGLPLGLGVDGDGLHYVGEFSLSASPDALGTFTVAYLPNNAPPNGGSAIIDHTGVGQIVSALQPLQITVIEQGNCLTVADCGDINGNGISDDACFWYQCSGFLCNNVARVFADAGGAFGNCPPDGFANVHDRNHALTCFAGTSSCETLNVDIGGAFGACPPDGFCNVHDANHTLAAFAGTTTCSCPGGGPAPEGPGPVVVEAVGLNFIAPRGTVAPGEEFAVTVRLDAALANLQSYQLDVRASGGSRGELQLVAIDVNTTGDAAFGNGTGLFTAHHLANGQMLAGLTHGMPVPAAATLATYRYRASKDAAGAFVVDLGEPAHTFLIADFNDMIAIDGTRPVVIKIDRPLRARTR